MLIIAWCALVSYELIQQMKPKAGVPEDIRQLYAIDKDMQSQIDELKLAIENNRVVGINESQKRIDVLENQILEYSAKVKGHQSTIDEVRKILDEQKVVAKAQQMIKDSQAQQQKQMIQKPEEKK